MTTRTVIMCDICGHQAPPRKLLAHAVDAATEHGFRLYEWKPNVWIDLCPECWENQQ